jgi:small ligand-binding sensory domain FIST
MPFAAALSTRSDTAQALEEAQEAVGNELSPEADLALLFFSPHHRRDLEPLLARARERLRVRHLLGCMGEAIVGNDREIEQQPALSLWLARWSAPVRATPFRLELEQTPEGPSLFGWPDALADADPARALILLLADPLTFPAHAFLERLNGNYPGLRVVGGMASGDRGASHLAWDARIVDSGAVGVLLQGDLGARSIVSQGCRPIGRHMVITRGEDNVIAELGGQPALQRLRELWQDLNAHERELVQQGLHVGQVINEYQATFQRGDFLVRNVIGIDQDSGAVAITDRIRVGQTVQFHVRDAATADEDLRALLQMDAQAHARRPQAAWLFTCNGRGTRLFPQPHHDVRTLRAERGSVPVAGFFAQGELGPVGGKNFMHGFTASMVLFEE